MGTTFPPRSPHIAVERDSPVKQPRPNSPFAAPSARPGTPPPPPPLAATATAAQRLSGPMARSAAAALGARRSAHGFGSALRPEGPSVLVARAPAAATSSASQRL